ncbi:MAG: tetratricopeptide repeat protein [Myxococcales bacterium]|nr:tetratricopeptide repeat protein [Myxococcales bacterium]
MILVGPAQAQSLEELFEKGNALYWEGKYTEAVSTYTDLVEKYGVSNSQLYYNLGTACIRANKPGLAIFYLKRALKLSPSSALEEDIRANLDLVRASLVERYRKELAIEQFVFDEPVTFSYTLFHFVPADVARWGLVGAWALLFVSLSLLRLRKGNRRWMAGFSWVFGGLSIVFGGFWIGHIATEKTTLIGVIVKDNVALREGQHPNAPSHPLPEGLELRIVDSSDPDLIRVQASNGLEGWVDHNAVREI